MLSYLSVIVTGKKLYWSYQLLDICTYSSTVCRMSKTAFWSSSQAAPSFRTHPPAAAWSSLWATGAYLLHCCSPGTAEGQPASPRYLPRATGESLFQQVEHTFSQLKSNRAPSHSFFFSLITACSSDENIFLKYIFTEMPLLGWWS